jgi:hypothetical protein
MEWRVSKIFYYGGHGDHGVEDGNFGMAMAADGMRSGMPFLIG